MMNDSMVEYRSSRDQFPRTTEPYTLDELLYINDKLIKEFPVDQIAKAVKRSPRSIVYKFIEYRPLDKDGNYIWNRSVKTIEETKEYKEWKVTISLNQDVLNELLSDLDG